MKTVILSSSKSKTGGVERFTYYLANAFLGDGHEVLILGKEDVFGISKKILDLSKYVGLQQPVLGFLLGRKAQQIGFDICITNGMLGWNVKGGHILNVQHGTFARAAVRIDKGKSFLKYVMKFYLWAQFEGLAARRATKCIAVSNETKESIEKYYNVKNVLVIPNAVDTEFFKPVNLNKKNQAIFVGRFEYAKGKDILEGFKKHLESIGWNMVIAENLNQDELVTAYNESKVFLLPSLHEGCSYALLDAMACGLPFLASPVGLVSDFVSEKKFNECVVIQQTLESYIEKFHVLNDLSSEQQISLRGELRAYIMNTHGINDFTNRYLSIAKAII
jgi:glycosyltransferase involved in cell wall biosynthesis